MSSAHGIRELGFMLERFEIDKNDLQLLFNDSLMKNPIRTTDQFRAVFDSLSESPHRRHNSIQALVAEARKQLEPLVRSKSPSLGQTVDAYNKLVQMYNGWKPNIDNLTWLMKQAKTLRGDVADLEAVYRLKTLHQRIPTLFPYTTSPRSGFAEEMRRLAREYQRLMREEWIGYSEKRISLDDARKIRKNRELKETNAVENCVETAKLENLEREIEQLKEQFKTEKEGLNALLKSSNEEKDKLTTEKKDLTTSLENAENKCTTKLEALGNSHAVQIGLKQTIIERREQELRDERKNLLKETSQLNERNEKIKTLSEEIEKSKTSITNKDSELVSLKAEKIRLENELSQTKTKLTAAIGKNTESSSQLATCKENLTNAENKVKELENAKTNSENSIEEKNTLINNLTNDLNTEKNNTEQKQNDLAKKITEQQSLKNQLTEKERHKAEIEKKQGEITNLISSNASKQTDWNNEKLKLEQTIDHQKKENARLKRELIENKTNQISDSGFEGDEILRGAGIGIDYYESLVKYEEPKLNNFLYIYIDIVRPQLIGDEFASAIRAINLPQDNSSYGNALIFDNIHYVPLSQRHFNRIEVDIRDVAGNPVRFAPGVVNVKLHFKQVLKQL